MAILAPIDYPAILTNKDWQKKKGLLSKAAGETGVGAQMDKIEALFKAVDWPVFYAKTVCTKDNGVLLPGHATAKKALAKAEYTKKVEAVRAEVNKLVKTATDTATAWKKNKAIPASSAKHADAVAAAASLFHMSLKDNGTYFTAVNAEFDEEVTRLQRNVDIAAKGVRGKIATLKQDAAKVINNPTVAEFTGTSSAGFYQRIRGINADLATLSANPAIAAFNTNTWRPFSQASYLPKNDGEVKPKVKEVLGKVAELEKLLP